MRGRVEHLGGGIRKVPMHWCLGVGDASSLKGTQVLVGGSAWLCGSHATVASDPHRYNDPRIDGWVHGCLSGSTSADDN